MNTKSFDEFLELVVAAIQAKSSRIVRFTVGSVMRAWSEAVSQVSLFLQSLIVYVASITRLSTSSGSDVDSFVADFGVTREAAVAATGDVTFSRSTPTAAAYIPVGTELQTADGTQNFVVVADTSNSAYDATTERYTLAPGASSLAVPVQAETAGSGANVQAGTINTLLQPIAGIDSVSNTAAFINGQDEETDDALRARFAEIIAGATEATKIAIGAAIDGLQQGLTYTIAENQTKAGATQYGYFYVVVDNGSGNPTQTLLDSVYSAIDAVRGLTATFAVFAPTLVSVDIAMTVSAASTANAATVKGLVQTAIENYINGLQLGQTLPWSRLAQVAYDASPDVTNVTNVLANSGTADISVTASDVIKYGTVTIS